MTLYPIELDIAGHEVLVVGGGPVAARKVAGLVLAGATIRVLSPGFVPELREISGIRLEPGVYLPGAIGSARLVYACTDDREVNARVAADAQAAGCWCNVADDPDSSDFFVPAVLRRGDLSIAVGTGGAAPHLAASVRDGLESHFGPEWGMLIDELQRARSVIRDKVADLEVRRRLLATLSAGSSVELLRAAGPTAWRSWFHQVLDRATSHPEAGTKEQPT